MPSPDGREQGSNALPERISALSAAILRVSESLDLRNAA